ncbi:hypothetical protein NDI52_28450 [Leptolyngbya sp. PL-A3]
MDEQILSDYLPGTFISKRFSAIALPIKTPLPHGTACLTCSISFSDFTLQRRKAIALWSDLTRVSEELRKVEEMAARLGLQVPRASTTTRRKGSDRP